jgi:hypothetical protein
MPGYSRPAPTSAARAAVRPDGTRKGLRGRRDRYAGGFWSATLKTSFQSNCTVAFNVL